MALVAVGSVGQMGYYCLNVVWPIQITALLTTDNIKIGLLSVCFLVFLLCQNIFI